MDEKKIDRLNKLLAIRVSFTRNFLIGVVTGIGTVIGAALIGTLLVSLILSNIDRVPFLKDIFFPDSVEELIVDE